MTPKEYIPGQKIDDKLDTVIMRILGKECVVYKRYFHFKCKMDANKPAIDVSHDLFKKIPAGAYYIVDNGEIFFKLSKTRTEKIIGYGTFKGQNWVRGTLMYIAEDEQWIFDAEINQRRLNPAYLESLEEKAKEQAAKGEEKATAIREKILAYLRTHATTDLHVVSAAVDLPVGVVRSHMTDIGAIQPPKCEYLRKQEIRIQKEDGKTIKVKTARKNKLMQKIIAFIVDILEKLI